MSTTNGSASQYPDLQSALYPPASESAHGGSPWAHLQTLWNGKWLILGLAVLCSGLAYLYVQNQPKTYRTSASVLLAESNRPEQLTEVLAAPSSNRMARQLYFLRHSEVFARQVALTLRHRADSVTSAGPSLLRTPDGHLRSTAALTSALQDAVKIQRGAQDVPAFRFQVTSTHPEEAALLANTYAESYRTHLRRTSSARLRTSRRFLEEQKQKLNSRLRRLEDSIAAMVRSQGQAGLLSPADSGRGIIGQANQIAQQISALQEQKNKLELNLNMERALLDSARARLRRIRPNLADRAASTTPDQLRATQEQIASLKTEIQTIQARNESLRPSMQSKLEDMRQRLQTLRDRSQDLAQSYVEQALSTDAINPTGESGGLSSVVSLQRDITQHRIEITRLQARLEILNQQLEEQRAALRQSPNRTLARLRRQKKTTRELFVSLSKSLQRAQVSEESTPKQARILERAAPPTTPIGPDVWTNVILALMLGGVSGGGIVLAYDKIDDIVDDPDALKQKAGDLFGTIPPWQSASAPGRSADADDSMWVGIASPFSPAAEAYRHIATNIRVGLPTTPSTVLVTSPGTEEGKTTTSANLATALSEAGQDVLLVDADLQGPSLHRQFGVSRTPGLTDMLADVDDAVQILHRPDPLSNGQWPSPSGLEDQGGADDQRMGRMGLLAAGTKIPQPALLLQEAHLAPLMDRLAASWDIVLVDSPPALLYDDAPRMASLSDLVLLVAAAGSTRLNAYQEVHHRFEDLGADNVVGILNKYAPSRGDTYNYGAYASYRSDPTTKDRVVQNLHKGFRRLVKG